MRKIIAAFIIVLLLTACVNIEEEEPATDDNPCTDNQETNDENKDVTPRFT